MPVTEAQKPKVKKKKTTRDLSVQNHDFDLDTTDLELGEVMDSGFTQEQLALTQNTYDEAVERDKELRNVAKSIHELNTIFKDLAILVIDQGSALDRIDCNLESTARNMEHSLRELEDANEYSKAARLRNCILLLVAMILVMLVTMIESTGDYIAIGEVCQKPLSPADIAAGLRAEGFGTLLGGVMNSFPFTTFSQNTGVLRISGVRSRWVVATTGALMILLGFVPKLAALAAIVPSPVLGGCALVMFGTIAGTGFNILRRVDLDDNGNLIVVSVSLGMALLVIANPAFFDGFNSNVKVILANAITLAGLSALGLNALFNGVSKSEKTSA